MTTVTSTFKFWSAPFTFRPPNSFGILLGTGCDMVAPSNNRRQTNRATPGPIKLMAIPDIVWSALQVMAANA